MLFLLSRTTSAVRCAVLTTTLVLASQPALAAALYYTHVQNDINLTTLGEGTTYAYGYDTTAGDGWMEGTATVDDAKIYNVAKTYRQTGTIPNIQVTSAMTFFDVVFTDESNPSNTGTIDVRVNFLMSYYVGGVGPNSFVVKVKLAPEPFNTEIHNQSYSSVGDVLLPYQTDLVEVELATPYRLYLLGDLDRRGLSSFTGTQGYARLELDPIPFDLPAGYTANSVDAGIVNNGAIPVPALGPWWSTPALLCALLIGVGYRASERWRTRAES